ncbi:MAG: SDR family NAD(P)-dependent oxidoreductase [Dehalococcoidia bacterium]
MDLENTVAVVTGAASGIGKEIAFELARHGSTLVLVDIKEDGLANVLGEIHKYAPASTAEVCDISNNTRVNEMIQSVHERHGSIDILVNNAGMMIVKSFNELAEEEFSRQMDVNFYGAVSLIRSVVPIMQRRGKGVIINVASVGGKLVVPGTTAYSASKAALYAFSESLYYELKDKGIHVGVVLPGGMRTEILDSADLSRLGAYYRGQCKTPPSRITGSIRKAIEKERFETVVPSSYKFLIGFHGVFPGLLRKSLLRRLRPYFD